MQYQGDLIQIWGAHTLKMDAILTQKLLVNSTFNYKETCITMHVQFWHRNSYMQNIIAFVLFTAYGNTLLKAFMCNALQSSLNALIVPCNAPCNALQTMMNNSS